MSNSSESPPPAAPPRDWITVLADNRPAFSYGLLLLGLALAALPVWLFLQYHLNYVWVGAVSVLLVLIPLGGGLWNLLREPGELSEVELIRMFLLILGGLFGLGLTVLALVLAAHSSYREVLVGGLTAWQGPEKWRLWLVALCFIAGLVFMFVSLQLGRAEERSRVVVRRLVYGYNALLSGLLLLAVLVVLVVMAGIFVSSYDWTSRSIYSLSPESVNILQGLKKPTKIYVIVSPREDYRLDRMIRALLDNCREVNDRIQVEYLSPDRDADRVKELARKYEIRDRQGVLVVSGVEPRQQSQFITVADLRGQSAGAMMRDRGPRDFKGESELMNALSFLEEGKQKPVLYFTQGNNELAVAGPEAHDPQRGAALLKRRLEGENYVVKGLRFTSVAEVKSSEPDIVTDTKVPDDAGVVIVAGAQSRLPDYALQAIRDFVDKKKGALVVLFDAPWDKTPEATGLEEMLASHGVEVKTDRLLNLERQPYVVMRAFTSQNREFMTRNEIGERFFAQPFLLFGARTVQSSATSGAFVADNLLIVPSGQFGQEIVVDDHFTTTPRDYLVNLSKAGKLGNMISERPVPVGVVVSETSGGMPEGPHGFMNPGGTRKPRMVVLGNRTLISNHVIAGGPFGPCYDLFASCLAWLRERPSNIGIKPKSLDTYEPMPNADWSRMFWTPMLLMLTAIVGLGAGVWVVRRR